MPNICTCERVGWWQWQWLEVVAQERTEKWKHFQDISKQQTNVHLRCIKTQLHNNVSWLIRDGIHLQDKNVLPSLYIWRIKQVCGRDGIWDLSCNLCSFIVSRSLDTRETLSDAVKKWKQQFLCHFDLPSCLSHAHFISFLSEKHDSGRKESKMETKQVKLKSWNGKLGCMFSVSIFMAQQQKTDETRKGQRELFRRRTRIRYKHIYFNPISDD